MEKRRPKWRPGLHMHEHETVDKPIRGCRVANHTIEACRFSCSRSSAATLQGFGALFFPKLSSRWRSFPRVRDVSCSSRMVAPSSHLHLLGCPGSRPSANVASRQNIVCAAARHDARLRSTSLWLQHMQEARYGLCDPATLRDFDSKSPRVSCAMIEKICTVWQPWWSSLWQAPDTEREV